jgi:Uma2 family endonuclease
MNESKQGRTAQGIRADDFVAGERKGGEKREFFGGELLPRAGGDRFHNLIVSNIAIGIGSRLHGHKAEIYIGNMLVKLNHKAYCYPDVSIVTGEPSFTDAEADVLLNPAIIADIFSNETDSVAKTRKLESYLEIPSIKECLLVKKDEMRVEHYARQNKKQWLYRIYNERDDVITLDPIQCKLSLQEVYAMVKFSKASFASNAVN